MENEVAEFTPEEQARHTKLFADFIRVTRDFQVANGLDLTTLAKSQIWGLKETVRQAMGVELGTKEDNDLTQFFIEHVFALMTHISNGSVPCLH